MNAREIVNILNFASFRPEPDDPSASWASRFPNEKTILLTVNRGSVTWCEVQKGGRIIPGDTITGEHKEIFTQIGTQLKDHTENGWASICLNTRYVITLETNLSRRPGSEETVKLTPRSVLGARYERGKRYSVTHNPETNSSILLACDEEQIRKIESMLREAGIKPARISCGTYVLLRHALSTTNVSKSEDKTLSAFYIACCHGSVCALVQDQDRWLEIRSRTDVYEDTIDPIVELLAPFQQRISPDSEVILIADRQIEGLHDALTNVFQGHKFTDLSTPTTLWSLLAKN
jgi:hypothetical protein